MQAPFAGYAIEAAVQAQDRAGNLAKPAPLIDAKHVGGPRLDDLGRQSSPKLAKARFEFGRACGSKQSGLHDHGGYLPKVEQLRKGGEQRGEGMPRKAGRQYQSRHARIPGGDLDSDWTGEGFAQDRKPSNRRLRGGEGGQDVIAGRAVERVGNDLNGTGQGEPAGQPFEQFTGPVHARQEKDGDARRSGHPAILPPHDEEGVHSPCPSLPCPSAPACTPRASRTGRRACVRRVSRSHAALREWA